MTEFVLIDSVVVPYQDRQLLIEWLHNALLKTDPHYSLLLNACLRYLRTHKIPQTRRTVSNSFVALFSEQVITNCIPVPKDKAKANIIAELSDQEFRQSGLSKGPKLG